MSSHEDYKEMLALEALGTLDESEARELAAHLSSCAECAAELDEWHETAAALAYSAERANPSEDLRGRILADARKSGAQSLGAKALEAEAEDGLKSSSTSRSNVVEFSPSSRSRAGTLLRFGALAASIVALALAVSLFIVWNRLNALRAEMAEVNVRTNETRKALEEERKKLALLTGPDTRMVTLAGTPMAQSATAMIAYDRKTGRAMLAANGLPPAPAGKAYQLWFIAEGRPPMPGHVFKTDAAGHAEMSDDMPAEARSAKVFAITLEPDGGMPAPTGDKYLVGSAS